MNTYIKYIAFILVFVFIGQPKAKGQTVEKLVRFHTKTNTNMSPFERKIVQNKILTIYSCNNKDTLFINDIAQDSVIEKYSALRALFISSFDTSHQIIKTGIMQTDKGRQIGFRNFFNDGNKIYLTVEIDGDQLLYNGALVWQGEETEFYTFSRQLILELDLDLNYRRVYGFDHYHSGIQAIAVQEGRLHLFGHLINKNAGQTDTVEVEGHTLTSITDQENWSTLFALTFDTQTGLLLNELKINGGYFYNRGVVEQVKISTNGDIYQLMRTSASAIILEGQMYLMTDFASNTYMLKYNRDGKLINKAFFTLNNNYVDIQQMEVTSDRDVILYGDAQRSFGVNGRLLTEFPYPDAAIVLRLDGETLEPEWYDYYAVERNGGLTVRTGGLTMDEKENIYVMNSHGRAITRAEDKEGNSLLAGNHIYKYSSGGVRLADYHTPSRAGSRLYPVALREDTLIFLINPGGDIGNYDSTFHIRKEFECEIFLLQYILHGQSNDLEETQISTPWQVYPNPVRSGDDITLRSDITMTPGTPYTLIDRLGRLCDRGVISRDDTIRISDQISPGLYFISAQMETKVLTCKLIVTE